MIKPEDRDRQQRGLIATWTIWMAWFSWFFGANVLILWTRRDLEVEGFQSLVASIWLFFNLSGVAVALMVSRYTLQIGRQFGDVGFPIQYAAAAGVLNALALLGNCLIWSKIL